jgi:hypothetical protein
MNWGAEQEQRHEQDQQYLLQKGISWCRVLTRHTRSCSSSSGKYVHAAHVGCVVCWQSICVFGLDCVAPAAQECTCSANPSASQGYALGGHGTWSPFGGMSFFIAWCWWPVLAIARLSAAHPAQPVASTVAPRQLATCCRCTILERVCFLEHGTVAPAAPSRPPLRGPGQLLAGQSEHACCAVAQGARQLGGVVLLVGWTLGRVTHL